MPPNVVRCKYSVTKWKYNYFRTSAELEQISLVTPNSKFIVIPNLDFFFFEKCALKSFDCVCVCVRTDARCPPSTFPQLYMLSDESKTVRAVEYYREKPKEWSVNAKSLAN